MNYKAGEQRADGAEYAERDGPGRPFRRGAGMEDARQLLRVLQRQISKSSASFIFDLEGPPDSMKNDGYAQSRAENQAQSPDARGRRTSVNCDLAQDQSAVAGLLIGAGVEGGSIAGDPR